MRVALVVERFEPGAGGVENVAWQTAHGLARAGDDVHVVARRAAESPAVTLHRVRVPASWQPLRVAAFSRAAARAAPRGSYDVVYSCARTAHQDVYRAGGGSHADYVERRYARPPTRLSPRHAVLLALERRVFGDPTQLVQCNSDMVRGQLSRRYALPGSRLFVLRNGVDLDTYHPRRRAREGRRLRGELAAGDAPVWLFAGTGFARKGLDVALGALARARGPSALWVAGADATAPWRRRCEELGIAERVRFLGRRRDLPALYAAADALLLPTRYDAFANVCLEAAASGIPVVTSASNGAAEVLRGAGIVVERADDVQGFADALTALADAGARERLGAAARAVAESHGWDVHVAGLRDLFSRLPR